MGNLPTPGTKAPDFSVTKLDLGELTLGDLMGKMVLLNIFSSIDMGVCVVSVRQFSTRAVAHPDVMVVSVSQDLSFALGRFCGTEGIEHVITTSGFRLSSGTDYGVKLADSPMTGLLARTVVIIGADGIVKHIELVEDIAQNLNPEAALASL